MADTPKSPGLPVSGPRRRTEPHEAKVKRAAPSRNGEPTGLLESWDLLLLRLFFTVLCVVIGWHFHPFGLSRTAGAVFGLIFAVSIILCELRVRRLSLRRLIGAGVGSILGVLGALLIHLVVNMTTIPPETKSFVGIALVVVLGYVGLVVGANKGAMLNLQAFGGVFGSERSAGHHPAKILDTSVIIDGRIADVCEAFFLEGPLVLPRFVLRELQLVADSSDSLKRQRGRRGLEVLERLRQLSGMEVEIAEEDFPEVPEVDLKLVELARRRDAKIITNDFNLNKVAQLHNIEVLNVNQLANALKPVVLPGETMRVFILREGKEQGQGVGYLDDGTMVVVDGARRMINKTIDMTVTSVHQTSAGKMIFGRFDDRAEAAARPPAKEQPNLPADRSEAPVADRDRELRPRPIFPETFRR